MTKTILPMYFKELYVGAKVGKREITAMTKTKATVQCECGNITTIYNSKLLASRSQSCMRCAGFSEGFIKTQGSGNSRVRTDEEYRKLFNPDPPRDYKPTGEYALKMASRHVGRNVEIVPLNGTNNNVLKPNKTSKDFKKFSDEDAKLSKQWREIIGSGE